MSVILCSSKLQSHMHTHIASQPDKQVKCKKGQHSGVFLRYMHVITSTCTCIVGSLRLLGMNPMSIGSSMTELSSPLASNSSLIRLQGQCFSVFTYCTIRVKWSSTANPLVSVSQKYKQMNPCSVYILNQNGLSPWQKGRPGTQAI